MLYIGCHLSSSKGYLNMGQTAKEIGANTFQFFTRNPRGGTAKPMDKGDTDAFLQFQKENNFCRILAHAPYTLNPCSDKKETRDFAYRVFKDDLLRMEYTPGQLYNFHPGSHVGQGVEKGIELICDILNRVLEKDITTTVLLETMSGKGSEVGSKFQELKTIIDNTDLNEKIGVCLDTCHVYDAGYDIQNNLDGVLDEFDSIVGLSRLKAIHINDTMNPFSSHKDRHQKIGQGYIGIAAFENLINNPRLKNIPFLLETPNEIDGYKKEIELLKGLYKLT